MLLEQDPKLLLLDEPVAGLSDAETDRHRRAGARARARSFLVIVEHDMAFVRELAVKVTVLHEGSMLVDGSLAEAARTRASSTSISGDGGGRGEPLPSVDYASISSTARRRPCAPFR